MGDDTGHIVLREVILSREINSYLMIRKIPHSAYFFMTLLFITGCSLVGINFNAESPKKPKKYPKFTVRDSLRGKISPERSVYDVHYYDLNLDIDVKKKFLHGYVDFYFTAMSEFSRLQIDLFENMDINGIQYNGSEVPYERKYDAVFLNFNEKVRKGDRGMFRVHYSGKPMVAKKPPWEGGFVWEKDRKGNPWIGVACEGDGASLWWPVKDHLYDEPDSVLMNVTVPRELKVVSNGRLRTVDEKDGRATYRWFTSNPINSYNVTLYAGDFRKITMKYPKEDVTHELEFWVLPENLDKAKTHFKQTIDIIAFFESAFGEYPWWEDGFKMVESPYAGMEHQTAIAYGSGYSNGGYSGHDFDYIILHETAHEWWGNSVSARDMADLWIHEGFATYAEALYVEHTEGKKAYEQYVYIHSMFIKNHHPMVGPRDVNYFNYKDSDPYMKGSLMLHSLRFTMDNDTLFKDIIKTFAIENRKKVVESQDFIDLVNRKTGEDYTWFFNQFLHNYKSPRLEYTYDYDD
ncbi:MAG: M1 family metallopeptidase, partial [Bacteroidota bacterium]|nr:M1 family metallopeptidase [Bacteroidota bacterium]